MLRLSVAAKLGVGLAYTIPLELRRRHAAGLPMAGYPVVLAAIVTASFDGRVGLAANLSVVLFAILALRPSKH